MSATQQQKPPGSGQPPSAVYGSPREIIADPALSRADKKRLLDAWEEDARRLSVATEEGMTGGEMARLDEVAEAKAALKVEDDRRPAPTKTG
jgi:hypothetical protein